MGFAARLATYQLVLPGRAPPPGGPGDCPGALTAGPLPLQALYENMLVELPFAGFFLSKLLGTSADVDIHHLASLDPEVYRNLLFLKSYEGDVEELGLNFTVVNNDLGEAQVRPGAGRLPAGGAGGLLLWGPAPPRGSWRLVLSGREGTAGRRRLPHSRRPVTFSAWNLGSRCRRAVVSGLCCV